ncbi:MAG: alpha/beta hydrolase [Planktotalea sp.]|uniref:alpha/beta fold hydrolase n=1 Tax=Planktotalea sp. TaxID=2029877 RepID=UPI003C786634
MPSKKLDDIAFHYEIDGSGPPLVLAAGMLSDSASWGALVQPLAQHFTVIRPDNRSTGRTTPALAPTSPQQNAKDILALMDHLDLPRVQIAGHSMGGYIAAELAVLAPERIASLNLLCSAPMNLPRSWHLFQTFCDVRANGPEGLWLRSLFPWLFHHAFFDNPVQIEGAIAASLAYPHAQSLDAMQHQLNALKRYDPSGLTKRISVPTLALLAQNDLIVPHGEALDLLSQIPQADIQTVPNAGHSIHWDAPQAALDALIPFLKEHSDDNG